MNNGGVARGVARFAPRSSARGRTPIFSTEVVRGKK
jgi:hypothetical protein